MTIGLTESYLSFFRPKIDFFLKLKQSLGWNKFPALDRYCSFFTISGKLFVNLNA